jgi:endonuclease/exonuclease/phosphatase family metal-dependent hydrolase
MLDTVDRTNFPVRATGLAKEIKAAKPDLIGLQEAARWTTGPLNDPRFASTVRYDFVELLLKALRRQGVTYSVVVSQDEFNFEGPTLTQDVRLTMRDVILKRKGSKVKLGATSKGRYTDVFTVPTEVGPAESFRGWVAVDAKVGGRPFRFVSTHLEAYGDGLRAAQARELISTGPLGVATKPSILLGDFNSDPSDSGAAGDAIRALSGAGFADTFGSKHKTTFGQNEDLTSLKPLSSDFIDHVLYRPAARFTVRRSTVVGTKRFRKTAPLWTSDHFGVVATIRVK